MKNNEVEIVLQPTKEAPKLSDGEVKPTRVPQMRERNTDGFRQRKTNTPRIFCAPREMALLLLEDFIIMAGAQIEVAGGNVAEEQIKYVATSTQRFMIDLSDRLMIDCNLTEKDIEKIVKKVRPQPKDEPTVTE